MFCTFSFIALLLIVVGFFWYHRRQIKLFGERIEKLYDYAIGSLEKRLDAIEKKIK